MAMRAFGSIFGAIFIKSHDNGKTGEFEIDATSTKVNIEDMRNSTEYVYHGILDATRLDAGPPQRVPKTVKDYEKELAEHTKKGHINNMIATTYKINYLVQDVVSNRNGYMHRFKVNFSNGELIEGSRRSKVVNSSNWLYSRKLYTSHTTSTRLISGLESYYRRYEHYEIKGMIK